MISVLLSRPQAMILRRLAKEEISRIQSEGTFKNGAIYCDGGRYGTSIQPNLARAIFQLDKSIERKK